MSTIGGSAHMVLRVALRLLPAGRIRQRYHDELVADLHGLTARAQLLAALSILLRAPALRVAVTGGPIPSRRLWCWAHLHHQWALTSTDDGGLYNRCRRCGEVDDVSGPYVGSIWVMFGPSNP